MRIGARFRRWVGIFGAMSVVVGTVVGASLAVGQSAASASSSAWSLDLNTPTVIFQNTVGAGGTPPVSPVIPASNAADGWNFVATGWVAGDTITLTIGTGNGGPGVECNTNYLGNPNTPGFGVNQTDDDMSNYVLFSAADFVNGGPDAPLTTTPTSSIIESTSGSTAAYLSASPGPNATYSPNGQLCEGPGDGGSDTLVLTFLNTAPPLGTAQIFVGYANETGTPATAVSAPLTYTTGFAAASGAVPVSATYLGVGQPATAAVAITVPSNAIVAGETPGGNSPSSGIQRTTGSDVVPASVIPPFTITDAVGDQLPPNNNANNILLPPGYGIFGPQTVTVPDAPGVVCLQLDNHTHQNLQFVATPTWSVSPNAGTNTSSAATGGAAVVGAVGDILRLPVIADNPPGTATTWTTSALTLATQLGLHTHADGPVWAYVYYVPGPVSGANAVSCGDGISTTENLGDSLQGGPQPDSSNLQLGYVQLTTVSELATSIYGATQVDTAAQAIGHQFDYATGTCIGNQFPQFFNGGAIFLATDADYHDALGAAFPAGADNSGVALTDPGSLSPAAAAIIRQEGVQTVYLVGGTLAISNAVETTLASTPSYTCGGVSPRFAIGTGGTEDLTVIRIAGQTADDTNELLATFPGAEPITPTPGPFGAYAMPTLFNDTGAGLSSAAPTVPTQNTAVLVTDVTFQDAVSASALAYGWPMPLITTTPGGLSTDAIDALSNDHITQVILLGGTGAISDAIIPQLGAIGVSAIRVAGIDGSDTSTQLAAFELAAGTLAPLAPTIGLGVDNNDYDWSAFTARTAGEISSPNYQIHAHVVLLARGDFYADAETASVLAVHNGFYGYNTTLKPLILDESPGNLGTYVTTFLNDAGLAVSTLAGEAPSQGWDWYKDGFGAQVNDSSSNVYTLQPIGGILALSTSTLNAAIAAVTAG
jgi:hypothetical protein